jgi:hypothetical protein
MSDLGYLALGLGLLAVYLVAMAAVLFGGAGTLAVPMSWAYLALFAVLRRGHRRHLFAEPGSREAARRGRAGPSHSAHSEPAPVL